jgi:hypothetical protein
MTEVVAWLASMVAAAEEGAKNPPAWDTFAQYSVLGVAVLAFGWVLFKILNLLLTRSSEELSREVARGDRMEAENRELNNAMQDKAIPALFAAANALTEVTELLRDQQRERDYEIRRRTTGEGR